MMERNCWVIVLLMILGVYGCTSDGEPEMLSPKFSAAEASDITRIGVTLSGTVYAVGNGVVRTSGVVYSTEPDLANKVMVESRQAAEIRVTLDDLAPNTIYYYALYASSGFSTVYSDQIYSFKTVDRFVPALGKCEISAPLLQSVTLSCKILDDGGTIINKVGFGYKPTDGSADWKEIEAELKGDLFELEISNLVIGDEYIFYAFAINEDGKGQSAEMIRTLDSSDAGIGDMGDGGTLE